jgi:hypothetical protein
MSNVGSSEKIIAQAYFSEALYGSRFSVFSR